VKIDAWIYAVISYGACCPISRSTFLNNFNHCPNPIIFVFNRCQKALSRSARQYKENLEATSYHRKSRGMSGSQRELCCDHNINALNNCGSICQFLNHSNSDNRKVAIKTAPAYRFENERNVLQRFRGRPHIREMLDEPKILHQWCGNISTTTYYPFVARKP
jgi:hypothetical protein